MDWIYGLFNHSMNATIYDFDGAGCVFTNGIHILAGYQHKKKVSYISGIGGTRENDENYIYNALRELIEELFEVIPETSIIRILSERITPKSVNVHGRYILVEYTFDDLDNILKTLYYYSYNNLDLYTIFPATIMELILKRKQHEGEVKQLVLLPFEKNLSIDSLFIKDIDILKGKKN